MLSNENSRSNACILVIYNYLDLEYYFHIHFCDRHDFAIFCESSVNNQIFSYI